MGVDQARAIASGSAEVSIREIDAGLVIVLSKSVRGKLFISCQRAPNKHIHDDLPGFTVVNMNKRLSSRGAYYSW